MLSVSQKSVSNCPGNQRTWCQKRYQRSRYTKQRDHRNHCKTLSISLSNVACALQSPNGMTLRVQPANIRYLNPGWKTIVYRSTYTVCRRSVVKGKRP